MSALVIALLREEFEQRGGFPVEHHADIAAAIQRRVQEIRAGGSAPAVPAVKRKGFTSWYEREPGEEGMSRPTPSPLVRRLT